MKRLSLLIVIGVVMCSILAAGQEVYRWVDEKGTIHFADDESQVPEKYQNQIQKRQLSEEPPPSSKPSPPAAGPPKAAPKPATKQPVSAKPTSEKRDALGRGEDWWRGQAREWNAKLAESRHKHEAASAELKDKERELEEAKFKPDSLKRKIRADIKALEERVNETKKQMDEAKNMVERVLPKQAEESRADPNWLK